MRDTEPESTRSGETGRSRRGAVDALVLDGRQVWLVLGDDEIDTVAMLLGAGDDETAVPMRLCRGVLDGGRLLIGGPDVRADRLASELIAHDELDHA